MDVSKSVTFGKEETNSEVEEVFGEPKIMNLIKSQRIR